MSKLRLALLLTTLVLSTSLLKAQDDEEYRMEVGAAAGLNFGINDANSSFFGQGNGSVGGMLRFVLNPRSAVKVDLRYNVAKGNTKDVKDFQPAAPLTPGTERLKYSFSGGIADLGVLYELHFLPYGYRSGYQGYHRLVPYVQGGIGVAYSTVGEKVFAPVVPLGFGVKYKLSERVNLGFDWQMHFSLNDKLDGLEAPQGIKSTGFKNKDHFHTALITLTYSFAPKCVTCNKDDW